MGKMKHIHWLREKFGFSQSAMSAALGISRSHYSMYEAGLTSLSTEVYKRMFQLQLIAKQLEEDETTEKQLYLHPEEVQELENRLNLLEARLASAQKKLNQGNESQAQLKLRELRFQRVKHALESANPDQLLLLATELNEQRMQMRSLEQLSDMKQVNLRISIAKIDAEIAVLRDVLAVTSTPNQPTPNG
jgi:transcriptional regulator with XRE-family HTH domain